MKIILFANTDWYLYNFRLPLARALRSKGYEVVLVSPAGSYGNRLIQEGFRWVSFPLSRSTFNPFRELATLIRLVFVYRAERPDIVHHFTIKCVLYGSIAAHLVGVWSVVNAMTGLGHVFTDNGFLVKSIRPMVRMLYKIALRQTHVIFQNPDDLKLFQNYNLMSNGQFHLIRGSGVDVERFKPTDGAEERRERCVLFASRLLWAKGLGEYVEAARMVRASIPDTIFLIAGDTDPGNPAAVSEDVVERWKKQGDVQILGHLDDMIALLDRADLVILPSYREGLPRILLEAAACGLPLVATDVPGCREIVRHGVNGLLVPVKNSAALAEAIKSLLRDDELRASMGEQSRKIACEGFSQELVIGKTLSVYDLACSEAKQ